MSLGAEKSPRQAGAGSGQSPQNRGKFTAEHVGGILPEALETNLLRAGAEERCYERDGEEGATLEGSGASLMVQEAVISVPEKREQI